MPAPRRLGRPVTAALREVDALLTMWGEQTGGGGDSHRLSWPKESTLGRLIRQGPTGAGQSSRYVAPIPAPIAAVDAAVKRLPSRTKRVITLWYRSRDRFNRSLCLHAARMPPTEFKWRLRIGRETIAESLGLC